MRYVQLLWIHQHIGKWSLNSGYFRILRMQNLNHQLKTLVYPSIYRVERPSFWCWLGFRMPTLGRWPSVTGGNEVSAAERSHTQMHGAFTLKIPWNVCVWNQWKYRPVIKHSNGEIPYKWGLYLGTSTARWKIFQLVIGGYLGIFWDRNHEPKPETRHFTKAAGEQKPDRPSVSLLELFLAPT